MKGTKLGVKFSGDLKGDSIPQPQSVGARMSNEGQ